MFVSQQNQGYLLVNIDLKTKTFESIKGCLPMNNKRLTQFLVFKTWECGSVQCLEHGNVTRCQQMVFINKQLAKFMLINEIYL